MMALPQIMVAPNGARKTKAEHPALPITIAEIVETARRCFAAGADGLHAHVRDQAGKHILDAGLYQELLAEMAVAVPEMAVQITTEAVGMYSPLEQRVLVREVMPKMVSIALREMMEDNSLHDVAAFYHWTEEAGIAVQHILYDTHDIEVLGVLLHDGSIPKDNTQALIVLGRYSAGQISYPVDLLPLANALITIKPNVDWAACAFGQNETACLKSTLDIGGKRRVGFENNMQNSDGRVAIDNAARVREIASQ